MTTQSTTGKTKSASKAGGQRSFEDDMREKGTRSTIAEVDSSDDKKKTTETVETEQTETQSSEVETNGTVSQESDMQHADAPETDRSEASEVTTETVLQGIGVDPETATDSQRVLAQSAVEDVKAGNVTLDSVKESLEGIVQKEDTAGDDTTAPANSGPGIATATATKVAGRLKPVISPGQIVKQPDLAVAIIQCEQVYGKIQFGELKKWVRITKREASSLANAMQSFDTPATHGLKYFATLVEDGNLFMGER